MRSFDVIIVPPQGEPTKWNVQADLVLADTRGVRAYVSVTTAQHHGKVLSGEPFEYLGSKYLLVGQVFLGEGMSAIVEPA